MLLTRRVRYDGSSHEIRRNLMLAEGLGIREEGIPLPSLYPSASDVAAVDGLLRTWRGTRGISGELVAVAPGSIWNTKRWPQERFAEVIRQLAARGISVVLIGGKSDEELCRLIARSVEPEFLLNAAGKLSLLQSAELIRRSTLLLANDSAPMHCAVAMRVPVVAIFGPTVPRFGFAPAGIADRVLERDGLACRPCSIHGGKVCPVGTFECMLSIDAGSVTAEILAVRQRLRKG
jgi:heptosyltransferase-2